MLMILVVYNNDTGSLRMGTTQLTKAVPHLVNLFLLEIHAYLYYLYLRYRHRE